MEKSILSTMEFEQIITKFWNGSLLKKGKTLKKPYRIVWQMLIVIITIAAMLAFIYGMSYISSLLNHVFH